MAKRPSPSRDLDSCNLFVKYLPSNLTDDDLYNLFKEFGEIISSKIMIDQASGKSLGYGFVRFRTPEQAALAVDKMNGVKITSKRLLCKLAYHSSTGSANPFPASNGVTQAPGAAPRTSPRNQTPSSNLYIRPLLPSTTEDNLRDLFGRYGHVVDAKVMIDRNTGQSRLIGFVRFETDTEASNAMKELQGHVLADDATPLQIKFADSDRQKEQRRARNHQFQQGHMMPPFSPGSPVGIQYWPVPVPAASMPWFYPSGASPPGMGPYPTMPGGWGMPPYGVPMPAFPGHPTSPPHEAGGNSNAHAPMSAGGEVIPGHYPLDFGHGQMMPPDPAHFPHMRPAHMMPPPGRPYDMNGLNIAFQSVQISPSSSFSHQSDSHDSSDGTSPNQQRKQRASLVGAGGEVADN